MEHKLNIREEGTLRDGRDSNQYDIKMRIYFVILKKMLRFCFCVTIVN